MTACRIETRSCSFWGSFSLAMSRQSWRNRSTLYMKTGSPPNRDIFLQDEAQWNTGLCVWYRTEVVTLDTAGCAIAHRSPRNTSHRCRRAQLTAAAPALRRILAAADGMNAASIECQTQNGTAAGGQTVCHYLPHGGSLARCET